MKGRSEDSLRYGVYIVVVKNSRHNLIQHLFDHVHIYFVLTFFWPLRFESWGYI